MSPLQSPGLFPFPSGRANQPPRRLPRIIVRSRLTGE